jgi:hypothetical protein
MMAGEATHVVLQVSEYPGITPRTSRGAGNFSSLVEDRVLEGG